MSREWGENKPGIVACGPLGCGPVKSAEALPTSTPKEACCRIRRCRLRLDDSNVEVGTETADFNVFFAAEAETPTPMVAQHSPQKASQRSPSLTENRSLRLLSCLRTQASQTTPPKPTEHELKLGKNTVEQNWTETCRTPPGRTPASPSWLCVISFYRPPRGALRRLPPLASAYRRCLPPVAVAASCRWSSRQVAAASLRLGLADGAGSEGYTAGVVRRPDPPSAAAARAVLSADYVKKKMNSEVGIRDADFTYIKNIFLFEVGIRDADFGTVEVGIPCADFRIKEWFGSRHPGCRLWNS